MHVGVHQGCTTVKGLDGGGHIHNASPSNEHLGLEVERHVHGLHSTEALGDAGLVVRDVQGLVSPPGVILPVGLVCSRGGIKLKEKGGSRLAM